MHMTAKVLTVRHSPFNLRHNTDARSTESAQDTAVVQMAYLPRGNQSDMTTSRHNSR